MMYSIGMKVLDINSKFFTARLPISYLTKVESLFEVEPTKSEILSLKRSEKERSEGKSFSLDYALSILRK